MTGLDGAGRFSVFPRVKHAHRTTGFFKVRGVNINHAELEDLLFRDELGWCAVVPRHGERVRLD